MSHWKRNREMHKWLLTRGSMTQKVWPTPRAGRDSPSRSTCRYVVLQAWCGKAREGSSGSDPREGKIPGHSLITAAALLFALCQQDCWSECSWRTQALLPKGKPMEQQRPGSSSGISRDLQSPLGCCSRKKYELNHPPLLHPQS